MEFISASLIHFSIVIWLFTRVGISGDNIPSSKRFLRNNDGRGEFDVQFDIEIIPLKASPLGTRLIRPILATVLDKYVYWEGGRISQEGDVDDSHMNNPRKCIRGYDIYVFSCLTLCFAVFLS